MRNLELENYINQLIDPDKMSDYTVNGLQVEGRPSVIKIVAAVTANQETIDHAIKVGADALLVHHGYFWKGSSPAIRGYHKQRLQKLLSHDINLFAYHLPLDFDRKYGNNVEIARLIGADSWSYQNPKDYYVVAKFELGIDPEELHQRLEKLAQRPVIHISKNCPERIYNVGICTGGGQGFHDAAYASGCDAYITGEISEYNQHSAVEQGIHYYAMGHHASERYGVQALAKHLMEQFPELQIEFFDYENKG